ncbi:MAG: insulinase family protein, partial [Verrucomicrobiaceae bacterium]|nr:insulinase family protein [Verrucomicrobiaceae bacterium]
MFRTLLFSLHAILLFQVTGEVVPSAWPQKASDIPPDARLHFGQLANGLRHVTMRHAEPPGRVSIRLYVHAGSLMEKDNQRGLAHFLEHMAFNGTSHFKGTEIVEFLQRLGMAFGPDINAHTSFDETVYKLDLPDVKEETIDQGLTIMRDWADGML